MIDSSYRQMFELSRDDKKGLVLFVNGQNVPGIVIAFSEEAVELYSQQYERIVVRVDRIDGMARQ